jgi:hypothetical protein
LPQTALQVTNPPAPIGGGVVVAPPAPLVDPPLPVVASPLVEPPLLVGPPPPVDVLPLVDPPLPAEVSLPVAAPVLALVGTAGEPEVPCEPGLVCRACPPQAKATSAAKAATLLVMSRAGSNKRAWHSLTQPSHPTIPHAV